MHKDYFYKNGSTMSISDGRAYRISFKCKTYKKLLADLNCYNLKNIHYLNNFLNSNTKI